jgi:2-isopropylmalate synthase
MTGDHVLPTASVKLDLDGEIKSCANIGVGPVDAALGAIQSLIKEMVDITLEEYHIEAITGGTNALGEVIVKTGDEQGNRVTGRSTDEDIVKASVEAIISSVNKLLMLRK